MVGEPEPLHFSPVQRHLQLKLYGNDYNEKDIANKHILNRFLYRCFFVATALMVSRLPVVYLCTSCSGQEVEE